MSSITRRARRGCLTWVLAGDLVLLIIFAAGYIFYAHPDLAARGADVLRAVAGDEAVARLEMGLFQAQDAFQKTKYQLGLATPEPPWQAATPITLNSSVLPSPPAPTLTPLPLAQIADAERSLTTSPTWTEPGASETHAPTPTAAPLDTPTPTPWQQAPLTPLGQLPGEGIWSPYLQDAAGRIITYRAFLQPDPTRPFAVVAVIAFDLTHTRLHFILGFQEPWAENGPKRTGAMPEIDKAPNYLLAMFNGGFKATHGKFGAMADGVTALPARKDLGTLVIYQDGRVHMGVWGSSVQTSEDMECWRQNGPLVVADGAINPRVYNNSPKDWGYTVNDVSPTWRSGIGVSADGQTLFYFAGKSLTMEALGKAMIAAGAAQGMQLDINTYWVHFVAVRDSGDQRALEPLFPEMMKENISRYLYPYSRDYFYVTAKP